MSTKIERGDGTQLNARNSSSASRSTSPWGSASSSDANVELAAERAVVERLDPEAVAREHELPRARVPDRDREHPAQPLPEARAPLLVAVREHFGVAAGAKDVPGTPEVVPQLAVVVDLAVLDDDDRAVLVRDRLVAARQVDDREPAGGDADALVRVHALGVGAAMEERLRHRTQPVDVERRVRGRDPADPAHPGEVSCAARRPARRRGTP